MLGLFLVRFFAPAWLHGTPEHHRSPSYSFNGLADPHATPREYRDTLEGWFADKLPDLNNDDPRLGLYLAQNAMWWTEIAQLDGFRLDTFPYSTREFWSGWHERLLKVYPHLNDVGEVADPDSTITAFFEGGRKQFDGIDSGLATVFDFPLCNILRAVIIKGEPMKEIVDILRHDDLYPHPEMLVTFFGNHDDTIHCMAMYVKRRIEQVGTPAAGGGYEREGFNRRRPNTGPAAVINDPRMAGPGK